MGWTKISFLISGLLFLSVVPYAGEYFWTEAAIMLVIFALAFALMLRNLFSEQLGRNEEISSSAYLDDRRILLPIIAFAALAFLQALCTLLIHHGVVDRYFFLPSSYDLMASFWGSLRFLSLACLLVLMGESFRRDIRPLLLTLVLTGNFYAIFGIIRYLLQQASPEFFPTFLLDRLVPGVGFGTYINQNHFAFLMLMTLGLNLALASFSKLSSLLRVMLLVMSMITWVAIVLTGSRGGIVSSFVTISVFLLFPQAVRLRGALESSSREIEPTLSTLIKRIAVFGGLMVCLIVGIVLVGQDRVVGRFEDIPSQLKIEAAPDGFQRVDVWDATMEMIGEDPLFGVGLGGFPVAISQYVNISGAIAPEQAHNDYLELLAAGGIVGVGCGIWFLHQYWIALRNRLRKPERSLLRAARFGSICAFAGAAFHSLFDFGAHMPANWLFAAGLVVVSLHYSPASVTGAEPSTSTANSRLAAAALAVLFAFFAFLCLIFGLSRLNNQLLRNGTQPFPLPSWAALPFDSETFETRAIYGNSNRGSQSALDDLTEAVKYRPLDFSLWSRLGDLQEKAGQTEKADASHRHAIALAPHYGLPYFNYAAFLIGDHRLNEGLEQLRAAYRRDLRYFETAVETAWSATGGDPDRTVQLVSPRGTVEKYELAQFLLGKNSYTSVSELLCANVVNDDLGRRHQVITQMFEKRQFSSAYKLYKQDCDPHFDEVGLEDGSFESGKLDRGLGFGWRIGELPNTTDVLLERRKEPDGGIALKFDFNGHIDPSVSLLSQAAVAEKNGRYRLSFEYKTDDIKTGGPLVVQVILKQTESELRVANVPLQPDTNSWTRSNLDFQTIDGTEAIEIVLSRQPCQQGLCPIYGSLRLDNFELVLK